MTEIETGTEFTMANNPTIQVGEAVQLVMLPSLQKAYIRWIRENIPKLFLENENTKVPNDDEDVWAQYGNQFLERLFPNPCRVVFRRNDLREKKQWLVFPHPEDAANRNLFDLDNKLPMFGVGLADDTPTILGFFFKPSSSALQIRPSDGIATLSVDTERHAKGVKWLSCPNELKQWLTSLQSERDKTGENIEDWLAYLEFEEKEAKKQQWGARVVGALPPNEKTFNWTYKVIAPSDVWRRLKKSKGQELYFAPPDMSSSDCYWIPVEDDKQEKGKKELREKKAGLLLKVDNKPVPISGALLNQYNDSSLEVGEIEIENAEISQESDNPLPDNFAGFVVNSIALTRIQIDRLRKGMERLRDQEATFNDVHDWIFDITRARNGPRDIPELQYPTLPNHPLNEDQEMMVRKALAAPDVSLCQGPPGGGKTTFIAETVHQELQAGHRVLLVSQTNLAVDNALGRLGQVPIVRPIRKFSRSATADAEAEKFMEGRVVQEFFIPSILESSRESHKTNQGLLNFASSIQDAPIRLTSIKQQWQTRNDELRKITQEHEILKIKIAEISDEIRDCTQKLQTIRTTKQFAMDGVIDFPPSSLDLFIDVDDYDGDSINFGIDLSDLTSRRSFREFHNSLVQLKGLLNTQVPTGVLSPEAIELDRQIESAVNQRDFDLAKKLDEERQALHTEGDNWSDWSRGVFGVTKSLENHPDSPPSFIQITNLSHALTESSPPENLSEIIDNANEWCNENIHRNTTEIPWLAESQYSEENTILSELRERCDQLLNESEQLLSVLNSKQADLDSKILESQSNLDDCNRMVDSLINEWNQVITSLPGFEQGLEIAGVEISKIETILEEWLVAHEEEIEQAETWSSIRQEWIQRLENPEPAVLRDFESIYDELVNIVGVTTSFCGRWAWYNQYLSEPFDLVIIDEVSKATPPELILAMLLGRRVLLVGDHKQLPPTFPHHKARKQTEVEGDESSAIEVFSEEELEKYEDMVTSSLFKKMYISAPEQIKHTLRKQYRMHRDIMQCINVFYENQLEAGFDEFDEARLKAHGFTFTKKHEWGMLAEGSHLISPDNHVVWIDSCFDRNGTYISETQTGTSKSNMREILITQELLEDMEIQVANAKQSTPQSEWGSHPMLQHLDYEAKLPVGFITFYGAQIRLFRDVILSGNWASANDKWPNLKVKAATVDRFQGAERPVIIVSTVVSKPVPEDQRLPFENAMDKREPKVLRNRSFAQGGIEAPNTSFIRSPERINVALSRAQNLLIVVGNKWGLEKTKTPIEYTTGSKDVQVYKKILEIISKKGGLLDGTEFC